MSEWETYSFFAHISAFYSTYHVLWSEMLEDTGEKKCACNDEHLQCAEIQQNEWAGCSNIEFL